MEDINVTKRLVEVRKLLGIEVLHNFVVNNENKFISSMEKGHF
ncbi:TPA: hypothetical protein IZ331_002806 [Enterococcus faecium]|uniref:RadC-like JAB domain-containing protein n=2 Tax=Lactobacillales TaxID=186826 RepID=A0AA47J410_9LACT|nr:MULTISPECIES: JAB domain-containing protein [Lactobacillales]MDT2779670.1 JAB domain-containing protein [Enterococcus lactis]MBX8959220.1 hypothetical protein [Enterococcus faecium]MBZ3645173.1 hypothetical protein [Enterococcus faecium]MCD5061630.1 hypothetical protein [Enterococcus faecium]MCU1872663.1 hypothetical protein [Enterococcus faecium]